MALTQSQVDLEYILRNKSGKTREEEDLLKSIQDLKTNGNEPKFQAKYTDKKNAKDNRV